MRAELDTQLSARIIARRQLAYTSKVSPVLDRPLFVRAASGLSWFEGKLAIIQDDASFVALVDPLGTHVEALPLQAGHAGLRQFDKSRGNKKEKLDLECCFTTELDGVSTFFALGSGASRHREQIIRIQRIPGGFDLRTVQARSLYDAFNSHTAFSGSELNLEGATVCDDKLLLWQRGNGAPKHGRLPINATCELTLDSFVRYLDDPDTHTVPSLQRICQYDLGGVDGVPFTFTDATPARAGSTLFLASAEASPNAVDDGAVVGAAIGIRQDDGTVRLTHLRAESGALCRDKVEGLVLDPEDESHAWLVMDPDDHTQPACLLEVRLDGAWR